MSFSTSTLKGSGLNEDLRLNKEEHVFFHVFLKFYFLIWKEKQIKKNQGNPKVYKGSRNVLKIKT